MLNIPCIPKLLFVLLCLCILNNQSKVFANEDTFELDDSSRRRLAKDPNCIKWGNTFDVSLNSKNVIRDCKLPDGRAICCSIYSNYTKGDVFSKPIGSNYNPLQDSTLSEEAIEQCSITKVYISSPQELRDLQKSKEISLISDDHTDPKRLQSLVEYVIHPETIRNSTLWLDRVKKHMNQQVLINEVNPIDLEYLSRFEITKTCNDGKVEKWIEWIEPISITARHPFGFGRCRNAVPFFSPSTPRTGRSDVDYVLLQSGKSHFLSSHSSNRKRKSRKSISKHYMLDAGTSTFDSSLFWFTCGYSQRGLGFDQIFGWEMTLLEPNDYWRRVPPQWKPFWHFYNVPIQADPTHADSPLRFIETISSPNDFVAFKLDIDHPDMEMPIALSLLNPNNPVTSLIDEFFFELHFRCEVMTSCGWGKRVPKESHDLLLDRPNILQFFIDLRKNGIRAHIWP